MNISIVILILLLVGAIIFFRQQNHVIKHIKKIYLFGVLLASGGCVGALGWLGAETSGNSNLFHHINPYIWTAIFVLGVCILIVATIIGIVYRDSKNEATEEKSD